MSITFRMSGARMDTGEDVSGTVRAPSREAAERKLRAQGILVSELTELPEAGADDDLMAALAQATATQPAMPTSAPPADLGYARATVRHPAPKVPEYTGLRLGGSVLLVFAVLYYAAAGVGVIVGLFMLVAAVVTGHRNFGIFGAPPLLYAVGMAMIGALFHALGAGCSALRDIARNSFAR